MDEDREDGEISSDGNPDVEAASAGDAGEPMDDGVVSASPVAALPKAIVEPITYEGEDFWIGLFEFRSRMWRKRRGLLSRSTVESYTTLLNVDFPFLSDIARKYPPSLRLIVLETVQPKLRVGQLFMITYKGGSLGREGAHDVIIPDINVSKVWINRYKKTC